MKACAEFHDVDPVRIMLRRNVITQMDLNTPQLQRMLQGAGDPMPVKCPVGRTSSKLLMPTSQLSAMTVVPRSP
jgi:hypothetical protein